MGASQIRRSPPLVGVGLVADAAERERLGNRLEGPAATNRFSLNTPVIAVVDGRFGFGQRVSLDDELFLFLLDMAMLHIKKKSTYLLAQSESRQIQKVDDYLKRELIN